MAYRKDVYRYGKYTEYEFKFKGKYGAKGEKRAPKQKATPEQIRKQNQWKKEKLVLRLIRANFTYGDLWVTLKFPNGTRMRGSELKEVRREFLKALRKEYRKRKQPLKYICRLEIGELGGPHIHMILNRFRDASGTAEVVQQIWQAFGKYLHYTPLYEEGEYKDLAHYITKPLNEDIAGQLTLFGGEEDRKIFSAYSTSHNLVKPEAETKIYGHWTMRRILSDGPVPSEGCYIDMDSVRCGVNPYTGMSYYYYTEIRMDAGAGGKGGDGG